MNNDKDKDTASALARVEPTAEIRQMANMIAQLYQSLRLEGFDHSDALKLVGNVFRHG